MKTEDTVVVRTYTAQQLADMAVLELASCGIEASVVTDNAGGAYPFLNLTNGVAVLVEKSRETEAKSILEQMNSKEEVLSTTVESSRKSKKFTPFLFGILGGAIVTSMGWWAYMHRYDNAIVKVYDKKGRIQQASYYKGGAIEKVEEDRNGDGKTDMWSIYSSGQCVRALSDNNFDGEVDYWSTYSDDFGSVAKWDLNFDGTPDAKSVYAHGIMEEMWCDVDFNGVFDALIKCSNGVTTLSEVTPNGTNVVFSRDKYQDGVLKEEWLDEDMDGTFDVKKAYDPMGKEISVTRLNK